VQVTDLGKPLEEAANHKDYDDGYENGDDRNKEDLCLFSVSIRRLRIFLNGLRHDFSALNIHDIIVY